MLGDSTKSFRTLILSFDFGFQKDHHLLRLRNDSIFEIDLLD